MTIQKSKSVTLDLDLQSGLIEQNKHWLPTTQDTVNWLSTALAMQTKLSIEKPFELTVRIVELPESEQLNGDYRDKHKPTNVLSFPSDIPDFVQAEEDAQYLGDLIICADVLEQEAQEQAKNLEHHWLHICIHGLLHLCGYDHENDHEADEMENLERSILAKFNIDDPYQDHTH